MGQGWASPPLPPGKYLLRARRSGFTARRTAVVEVTADGAPHGPTDQADTTTLVLLRTGEITGRVVADGGGPVAGARIHDRSATLEELGVIASPLPGAAAAAALPPGARPSGEGRTGTRQAVSGADGRFVLGDVPPGRLRIEILQPSMVPFRGKPLLLPGRTPGPGRADGVPGGAGRRPRDRRRWLPVGGARVVVRSSGGAAAALYAITGLGGDFALPLPPGDHILAAASDGRSDVTALARVVPGQSPAPVTLRFARAGTRVLAGVIKDSEGRPLAAARVLAVQRPGANEGRPLDEAATLASATTDSGGHFKLTGLPDTALRLEVVHPNYAPHRIDVDAVRPGAGLPGELVARVPVSGGIAGEVRERSSGGPVPGLPDRGRGSRGRDGEFSQPGARTPRRGAPSRFALGPLAPGSWRLRVRAAGYAPVERQITVPAATTPGEPSVRDLRLELGRASRRPALLPAATGRDQRPQPQRTADEREPSDGADRSTRARRVSGATAHPPDEEAIPPPQVAGLVPQGVDRAQGILIVRR